MEQKQYTLTKQKGEWYNSDKEKYGNGYLGSVARLS